MGIDFLYHYFMGTFKVSLIITQVGLIFFCLIPKLAVQIFFLTIKLKIKKLHSNFFEIIFFFNKKKFIKIFRC